MFHPIDASQSQAMSSELRPAAFGWHMNCKVCDQFSRDRGAGSLMGDGLLDFRAEKFSRKFQHFEAVCSELVRRVSVRAMERAKSFEECHPSGEQFPRKARACTIKSASFQATAVVGNSQSPSPQHRDVAVV